MISVQNVSKVYPTRFGEKLILDEISFALQKGEKLGILGRNGAGKSTLVRLISGAELPTAGHIQSTMSVSWPLAFGGAFQDTLTGVDNVRFISRIYKQDFEKNLEFVEDFAELGPYLREEVRTYSSGMRARLAFAISMIIEFDCFLIDEVGAVGDARFHSRCNVELFQKRSDRAMVIISHDASYVRDHCTRFGVLHDGRLEEFDDFEIAYGNFREKIGLSSAKLPAVERLPLDRKQLVETTHTVAVKDDAFQLLVQEADWQRDAKRWAEAESSYSDALRLYPYQRSYWVQKGHCAKEAGAYERAEAAYRTACALGEPLPDVRQHLLYTMKQLSASLKTYPAHVYASRAGKDQPPGIPDIELFSRSAWHVEDLADGEILSLIRENSTCDELLATMIGDPRFGQAHGERDARDASSHDQKSDTAKKRLDLADIPVWARNLVSVAQLKETNGDYASVASQIRVTQDAWPVLMKSGGFSTWPKTQAALEKRQSP